MKQIKKLLLQIFIGTLLGFPLGIIVGLWIKHTNINAVVIYLMTIIMLMIAGTIQVIFHEGGHLFFGILTGYKFVSFRVFNLVIIKNNDKLLFKKHSIVGTGGQCILQPPKLIDGKMPFILYNAGGAMMNFLVASVSFFVYLNLINKYSFLGLFLVLLFLMGVFFGLTNIIPMVIGGVTNDGYNIKLLKKDKRIIYYFWLQLEVTTLLSKGIRVGEIELLKDLDYEKLDIDNQLIFGVVLMYFNYLIDKKQFESAIQLANYLIDNTKRMISLYENELKCEMLFLKISLNEDKKEVEDLFGSLKKYIKATNKYPSRQRLLYAYEKLINNDLDKAKQHLILFDKVIKDYPYFGEIITEKELLEVVKQKG